jgi:hypothetical protein
MNRQEKLAAIDAFEGGGQAFDDLEGLDKTIVGFRPFPEAHP